MIAKVDFRLFAIPVSRKTIRTGVWNGRSDYSNIPNPEQLDGAGGPELVLVQVNRPTNGFEGRSSLALTEALAPKPDSIVHWAKDTKTFHSIVEELSKAGPELT
jgi:hypothetical protein